MSEMVTLAGAGLITLVFWNVIEPRFKEAARVNDRLGQRRQLQYIWATIGVFLLGLFVTGSLVALWNAR